MGILGAINVPIVWMSVTLVADAAPDAVEPCRTMAKIYWVGMFANFGALLLVMVYFIRRRYEARRIGAGSRARRAGRGAGRGRVMQASNWDFVIAAYVVTWVADCRISGIQPAGAESRARGVRRESTGREPGEGEAV